MDNESIKKPGSTLLLMMNIGTAMVVAGSVFMVQIFSVLFGLANGVVLQSNSDGQAVAQGLQALVSQATYLHDGLLESYVLCAVSLIMAVLSYTMFVRRGERNGSSSRKYGIMHFGFLFTYILIFGIIFIDSAQYLNELYVYVLYAGIALTGIIDIYFNYTIRAYKEQPNRLKRNIKIDPNTPFSNMLELHDKIFSNMHGNLRVVDKHFNSSALANFHRLLSDNLSNFNNITIITSTEMLDSNFGKNIVDFKKELEGNKVGFELRLMDDTDRVEQHERMMLDDSVAYKIPPFNIINKRSEHIILIGQGEAKRRFDYLYKRAISFENYSVKKGREEGAHQTPAA